MAYDKIEQFNSVKQKERYMIRVLVVERDSSTKARYLEKCPRGVEIIFCSDTQTAAELVGSSSDCFDVLIIQAVTRRAVGELYHAARTVSLLRTLVSQNCLPAKVFVLRRRYEGYVDYSDIVSPEHNLEVRDACWPFEDGGFAGLLS